MVKQGILSVRKQDEQRCELTGQEKPGSISPALRLSIWRRGTKDGGQGPQLKLGKEAQLG